MNDECLSSSFLITLSRKLMDGLRCIDDFTYRCLDAEHRNYFNTLYQGTTQVIVDLCQEGPYQTGKLTAHLLLSAGEVYAKHKTFDEKLKICPVFSYLLHRTGNEFCLLSLG